MTDAQPRNSARELAIIVLLVVVLTISFAVWMKSKVPRAAGNGEGGLEVGQPAPPIRVDGWVNGAPPADQTGKVVVINVWFTTCPACHARASEIVDAHRRFHDRGVVFIGLTFEPPEMLESIKKSAADMKFTWSNGYGAGETLNDLQAVYFPAYWVIGADGKIAWNDGSSEPLEQGIENALAAAGKG